MGRSRRDDFRRAVLVRALDSLIAVPVAAAPVAPTRPVYRSPVVIRHEPLRGRASKHRVGRSRARWL